MSFLPDDGELGWKYIQRYFELKAAGRMGVLWAEHGRFFLAPLPCGDRTDAERVLLPELKSLIDYWYPGRRWECGGLDGTMKRRGPDRMRISRIPAQSEVTPRYHLIRRSRYQSS